MDYAVPLSAAAQATIRDPRTLAPLNQHLGSESILKKQESSIVTYLADSIARYLSLFFGKVQKEIWPRETEQRDNR